MKLFECQGCGQALYFENTTCEKCGRRLGYLPEAAVLSAVAEDGPWVTPLAAPDTRVRFCANAVHGVCNWLIPHDSSESFCRACRHNHVVPDLSVADNLARWQRLEAAKHRLIYTLINLNLPLANRADDPQEGLAFDFLADPIDGTAPPVTTGHDHGLITLNLAEADDEAREQARAALGEPYRTLLGHFRHEVGHWYWDRLVRDRPDTLASFRALFGDERADYGSALQFHYDNGPPPDWQAHYVTAYAASHPWEDWAETWAHYLHIVDTLETARAFGVQVRPRIAQGEGLAGAVDFDPNRADAERLVEAWLPLTFAVNSLNRSMGQPDLYPFVLSPPAIAKLGFVRSCIARR